MQNFIYLTKGSKVLSGILLLLFIFFFNSCRKENSAEALVSTPDVAKDLSIKNAQLWYENTHPKSTNSSTKTQSVDIYQSLGVLKSFDPDWKNATSYIKNAKTVIEIPINFPDKISFFDHEVAHGGFDFTKSPSIIKYLIIKDSISYKAYLMTIIADSSYLKNDRSKLLKNTYKSRDPDFSGTLMYTTVEGKAISFFQYINGKITRSSINSTNTSNIKDAYSLKPLTVKSNNNTVTQGSDGCYVFSIPYVIITVGEDGRNQYSYASYNQIICTGSAGTDNPVDTPFPTSPSDPSTNFPDPGQSNVDINALLLLRLYMQFPEFEAWARDADKTPEEIALIIAYPIEAYAVYVNAQAARATTADRFPNSAPIGFVDDVSDAFRHALWNALNTKIIGEGQAWAFATAHEQTNPQDDHLKGAQKMDLANNASGRNYYLQIVRSLGQPYDTSTTSYIIQYIYDKAISGDLVMLDSNFNLIPSHL